jgi:hypothetical protein
MPGKKWHPNIFCERGKRIYNKEVVTKKRMKTPHLLSRLDGKEKRLLSKAEEEFHRDDANRCNINDYPEKTGLLWLAKRRVEEVVDSFLKREGSCLYVYRQLNPLGSSLYVGLTPLDDQNYDTEGISCHGLATND